MNDGDKKNPNATIQIDLNDLRAQVQLVDESGRVTTGAEAAGVTPAATSSAPPRTSRKAPPPLPPGESSPPASAPAAMLPPTPQTSQAPPQRSAGKTAIVFVTIVAIAIAAGLGVGSLLRGKGVTVPVASGGAASQAAPPAASTVERTLTVPEIVMSAPAVAPSGSAATP